MHLMRTGFLAGLFFLGLSLQSIAQTGKIMATVVDESGETMPGVNVYVKGETGSVSTNSVSTNIDGKLIYSLSPGTYTLVFKFVSYKERTIEGVVIKDNEVSELSVEMNPQDDSALTEIHAVISLNKDHNTSVKNSNLSNGVKQTTPNKSQTLRPITLFEKLLTQPLGWDLTNASNFRHD